MRSQRSMQWISASRRRGIHSSAGCGSCMLAGQLGCCLYWRAGYRQHNSSSCLGGCIVPGLDATGRVWERHR
jgi:hypothetical protein